MNLPRHPNGVIRSCLTLFVAVTSAIVNGEERPVRNRTTYTPPSIEELTAPPNSPSTLSPTNAPKGLQPVPRVENRLRMPQAPQEVAVVSGEEEADAPADNAPANEGTKQNLPRPSPGKQPKASPKGTNPAPIPVPMQYDEGMHQEPYLSEPVYQDYGGPVGCDTGFCGSPCDAMGCDGACGPVHPFHSEACLLDLPVLLDGLLFNEYKFYSADLLLFWQSGQAVPALVTTSATGTTAANAGVLGLGSTTILLGGGRYGNEMGTGFRLEMGHWLDDFHCQSLTARLWGAGKTDFSFDANSDRTPILARPFLNVTSGTPVQAAQRIAFGTDSGSINVNGSSDVYGADVLFRHLARKGLGGRVDWVMGYQMMRINQDLNISSLTTTGTGSANPGTTLAVRDSFDTKNEFHGFAMGWQGHYRDGCWSLETLLKVGLGNMHRTGSARGSTTTTNAAGSSTTTEGLLARATNSGELSSNTFAAAPEVQLAIGYKLTHNLDFTFGYNFIAVGNVVQAADLVDSRLAVNLDTTQGGPQNPRSPMTDSSFWVQGMHFGLDWNW